MRPVARLAEMIGNGDTFTWGTMQVSQKPNETTQSDYITAQINSAVATRWEKTL